MRKPKRKEIATVMPMPSPSLPKRAPAWGFPVPAGTAASAENASAWTPMRSDSTSTTAPRMIGRPKKNARREIETKSWVLTWIDPSRRVYELLLAREEGVAVRADFDMHRVLHGSAGFDHVAADAHDLRVVIARMDSSFHG